MMSNYEQKLVWEIHSAKEAIRILAAREESNKKQSFKEAVVISGEGLSTVEEKALSLLEKYEKMAPKGMSFSDLYFHLKIEMETWDAYEIPTSEVLNKKILDAMNYVTKGKEYTISKEELEKFDDLEGLDYDSIDDEYLWN